MRDLRGNVGTRLGKLDNGDYDAIILAVAGLKRLGLEQRIRCPLSAEESLPAVGQGAVGIECRLDDDVTRALLAPLNHRETEIRVRAERAMNTRLEGGCQVPIGSYAELTGDELWLRALVGAPDGSQMVCGERRGPSAQAEQMGVNWQKNCWLPVPVRSCMTFIREILLHDYSGNPPFSRRGTTGEPPARTWPGCLSRAADRLRPGNDLVRLPQGLAELQAGDVVFALSQHAVSYASSVINRAGLQWPGQLSYYAIGRTTALAMHRIGGLPVDYPREREISEMLLLLPALQQLTGKRALIMRGNGGRELLGETLAERGAVVSYYECYQRSPVHYDGSEQSAHWQRAGINTLVVTSGEMLQQLYTLVPDYYRSSWLYVAA